MANFTIPNRPAQSDQRDITLIEADFDSVTGYLDGIYKDRKLLWRGEAYVPSGTAAGLYALHTDGTVELATSGVFTQAWKWLWLDPADYTAGSPTKAPRVFCKIAGASANAPGITYAMQVNALTVGNSAGAMFPNVGTLLVGGAGVLLNASAQIASSDGFASAAGFGAAGAYVPLLNLSGASGGAADLIMSLFLTYA